MFGTDAALQLRDDLVHDALGFIIAKTKRDAQRPFLTKYYQYLCC